MKRTNDKNKIIKIIYIKNLLCKSANEFVFVFLTDAMIRKYSKTAGAWVSRYTIIHHTTWKGEGEGEGEGEVVSE